MWEVEDARAEPAIDGLARGRLIHARVRRGLPDGQRAALFDVGAGSTAAILGDAQQALLASSLAVGVRRLRDHWLQADLPSPDDLAIAGDWVGTVVSSSVARFRAVGFDLVVLTSGATLALARLAGRRLPRAGGVDRFELGLDDLTGWAARLSQVTAAQRALLPGVEEAQADTILPAAVIAGAIMQAAEVKRAWVCETISRDAPVAERSPGRELVPARPSLVDAPRSASSGT
jgi:exopolyphosphatase/guanosine-5'-triphosphate,3'-diphosphate pyrophosphatase